MKKQTYCLIWADENRVIQKIETTQNETDLSKTRNGLHPIILTESKFEMKYKVNERFVSLSDDELYDKVHA
jgi:hypothetical protein